MTTVKILGQRWVKVKPDQEILAGDFVISNAYGSIILCWEKEVYVELSNNAGGGSIYSKHIEYTPVHFDDSELDNITKTNGLELK